MRVMFSVAAAAYPYEVGVMMGSASRPRADVSIVYPDAAAAPGALAGAFRSQVIDDRFRDRWALIIGLSPGAGKEAVELV